MHTRTGLFCIPALPIAAGGERLVFSSKFMAKISFLFEVSANLCFIFLTISTAQLKTNNLHWPGYASIGQIMVQRTIYADPAGTTQLIVNTNIVDGHASQQRGLLASMSNTSASRTLDTGETVYVTKLDVKKDAVHLELLTEAVTTLGGALVRVIGQRSYSTSQTSTP